MKRICMFVVLLSIVLCGCQGKQENSETLNLNGIESVTIKVLPSPPKMKTVDNEKDIKSIIEYINHIDKQRVDQEELNGWEILIQTDGAQTHSIQFISNMLKIDDTWYKIGDTEVEKIQDLYRQLDYEEVDLK